MAGGRVSWSLLVVKGLAVALIAVAAAAAPATAADRVVRAFAVGSGSQATAVLDGGDEAEAEGPLAITVDDKGRILLLDQGNGRVVQFDPDRPAELPRALDLPEGLKPTDLVSVQDQVFAWDNGPHSLEVPESGSRLRSAVRTRGSGSDVSMAIAAFAQMGSEQLDDAPAGTRTRSLNQPVQKGLIPTRGRGPVSARVMVSLSGSSATIEVQPGANAAPTRLDLKVKDRIGSVELLDIDGNGRFYVLAESIPADIRKAPLAFVARFGASGSLDGAFVLPLSESAVVSRRAVTIDRSGQVYFLQSGQGRTSVVALGFRPVKAGAAIDFSRPRPAAGPRASSVNAALRQPTRAEIVERAMAFARLQWRVTPENYGKDPDTGCTGFQRVRRPGFLAGSLNRDVKGVPYCWGCHNNLTQITQRMARGDLAGNVCTRDQPRRDVVGVDCSAFVSTAWGLSSHFTTLAMPAITTPLASPWDLQPGDALNKPGSHIVLFLGFTPDRKIEVVEASTGRCNGRVCRNIYPLTAMLARGFVPVRFKGLAEAAVDPRPSGKRAQAR